MNDGAGWGLAGTKRLHEQSHIPSHTCTRPRAEAAGPHWIILNVCSHGSTALLYPGPAGDTAWEGGHNQQFRFSAHRLPVALSSQREIQLLPCVV